MSRLRTYRLDDAYEAVTRAARFRKPQREAFDVVASLLRTLPDDLGSIVPNLLYEQMADQGFSVETVPPQVVFHLATGVGKTRLMGALISFMYLSGQTRNCLVLAPRTAILEKLERETSRHSAKYLFLDPDLVPEPNLCFRENLDRYSPTDDGLNVLVLSPQSISGGDRRFARVSEFRGQSLQDYLRTVDDLVVFVDESHHLSDPSREVAAWTQAIHDLGPKLYFGFTATPRAGAGVTVAYSYDLGKCLREEKYTKAVQILVEPRDEHLSDEEWDHYTLDLALDRLERKRRAISARCASDPDFPQIEPVALVCAKDTQHADEVAAWLKSRRGLAEEQLLVTHSERRLTEAEILRLVNIDTPESKVRVVVNVFRLTEGWDVTNVYVIAPLREMATFTGAHQTMGRGLRLPGGARIGDPDVDTLDVLCCGRESLQTILDQAVREFGDSEGGGPTVGISSRSDRESEEAPVADVPFEVGVARQAEVVVPKVRRTLSEAPLDFEIYDSGEIGGTVVTAIDLRDLQTSGIAEGVRYELDGLVRHATAHVIAELPFLSAFEHSSKVQELIRRFLTALGASEEDRLSIDPVRLAKHVADEIDRRRRLQRSEVELLDLAPDTIVFGPYRWLVPEGFAGPLDQSGLVWNGEHRRLPVTGWSRCVHDCAAFDTESEFEVAGLLDRSSGIDWWARNDPARLRLPTPVGYFEPDFIYSATIDGVAHFGILEIKGDFLWNGEGSDARLKSSAACQWVRAQNSTGARCWRYALIIDDDVARSGTIEALYANAADSEAGSDDEGSS